LEFSIFPLRSFVGELICVCSRPTNISEVRQLALHQFAHFAPISGWKLINSLYSEFSRSPESVKTAIFSREHRPSP
jgi:hypothetical protein